MSNTPNPCNLAKKLPRYVLLAILSLGVVVFFLSGANELVKWTAISAHYTNLSNYVETHLWQSYLIFLLGYALVVAFSLPIALPLTLTGGALLGWPSLILVLFSATTGAGIVFIAARSIFANLLSARARPFMTKLEAGFSRNSFYYLLALRIIPAAPFWVVNIVPALTTMRLGPFLIATFIGITPGTTVIIYVGRGFDKILAAGQTPDLAVLTSATIIIPLVGLGILTLLPVIVSWLTGVKKT